MYLEELLSQAMQVRKDYQDISPSLLMRKMKISSRMATKLYNQILQHEAVIRFRNRRDNLISID